MGAEHRNGLHHHPEPGCSRCQLEGLGIYPAPAAQAFDAELTEALADVLGGARLADDFLAAQFDADLRYLAIANPHPDFTGVGVVGFRDDQLDPTGQPGIAELMQLKREALSSTAPIHRQITFARTDGPATYEVVARAIEPRRIGASLAARIRSVSNMANAVGPK